MLCSARGEVGTQGGESAGPPGRHADLHPLSRSRIQERIPPRGRCPSAQVDVAPGRGTRFSGVVMGRNDFQELRPETGYFLAAYTMNGRYGGNGGGPLLRHLAQGPVCEYHKGRNLLGSGQL